MLLPLCQWGNPRQQDPSLRLEKRKFAGVQAASFCGPQAFGKEVPSDRLVNSQAQEESSPQEKGRR